MLRVGSVLGPALLQPAGAECLLEPSFSTSALTLATQTLTLEQYRED